MSAPLTTASPDRKCGRPPHNDDLELYVAVTAAQRASGLKVKQFTDHRRTSFLDLAHLDRHGNPRELKGESLRRRLGHARNKLELGLDSTAIPGIVPSFRYAEYAQAEVERMIAEWMSV